MMRGAFLKSAAKVVVFSAKMLHLKGEKSNFLGNRLSSVSISSAEFGEGYTIIREIRRTLVGFLAVALMGWHKCFTEAGKGVCNTIEKHFIVRWMLEDSNFIAGRQEYKFIAMMEMNHREAKRGSMG